MPKLIAATALLIAANAFAAVPDDLERLVEARDYEAAYELAAANVDELEGDPTFDFNYGLAALETRHFSEAIFALERVLLRDPDQHRVRLELARAQFGSGNYAAARREFEAVLATNPPPAVKANINAFLGLIEQSEQAAAKRSDVILFGEFAGGFDSNVNSATDQDFVVLPINGLRADLRDGGSEIDDAFTRLSGGVLYRNALSRTRVFDAAGVITRRELLSNDQFDLTFVQLGAGYTFTIAGEHRLRFGARGLLIGLDTETFQRQVGVSTRWDYTLPAGITLTAAASGSILDYDDDPLRDAKQYLFNAGAAKSWGKVSHAIEVYGALEPADDTRRGKHNGRDFYGVNYRMQWALSDRVVPFARLSAQRAKHDASHPVFLKTREDKYVSAGAGVNWQPAKHWLIRGQLSYTNQNSNLDVFEYDRFQVEAGFTYSM